MTTETQNETLLVPVANPETSDRLLDTAIDIARGESMEILVLHVVQVPPQIPLSEGDILLSEDGAEEQLLADAVDRAKAADIPAEYRLRYARDVATGIVGAADKHDTKSLLVGWRGRPRRRDIILGSFIDRILGEADCNVFVKRIRSPIGDVDSILVPVADGPHTALAVELAATIASQHEANVNLLHVYHPDASETAQEQAEARFEEFESILAEKDITRKSNAIQSDHVAGAITDETPNYDLTIMGATRDPFLKRKLVGSVAQGVGRAAASSVILTRRAK